MIKILYKRFISKTPLFFKKLQKIFLTLSISIGAALTIMTQYGLMGDPLFILLTYIATALAFAIPLLQLTTTDEKLKDL